MKRINQDRLTSLMVDLMCAFTWDETPQGYAYWSEVMDALGSLFIDSESTEEAA